jgi:hypothetical protein
MTGDDFRFYRKIAVDIDVHKRSVIAVGGGENTPPFSYTIGNSRRLLPELLIIGLLDNWTLNTLSDRMIDQGRPFADDEIVDLGGRYPVKVIDADERVKSEFTIQAGRYFGADNYEVMQVIIPDKNGRFPDEPNCAKPYSEIPILRAQRKH